MAAQYNYWLVLLSVLVAALASYAALNLTARITAARGWVSHAWLIGGSVAMGAGIWSMHFIGMLAFISPVPLGYDVLTTLLSLVIAVVASGFALYVVSRPSLTWLLIITAGVVMGLAIASMHYVGMAAVKVDPPLAHYPPLVMASVAVAIAASMAALALAFKLRQPVPRLRWIKAASAVLMGLAISGMHYTAMAAVSIAPHATSVAHAVTDKHWLVGAVAASTVVILSVALMMSYIDAHTAARAERMSRSLEHATEANKAKDEFLAILGHELRNPLAAIANAVALLSTAEAGTPAHQVAREILDRQTKHLRRLVDDLLDVGRAVTGKMTLQTQPVELYSCVVNAVTALRASGRAAKHTLECTGSPVWINGDATRIEQVVTNLVTNSLNYSPEGSSVRVAVQQEATEAVLIVRDNGRGLRSEELAHVFELFYQAAPDNVRRTTGGLGIGLTLVRRLVELHGGAVRMESDGPGRGTAVIVRFPTTSEGAAPARRGHDRRRTVSRRIVLVDDDRDARESLRLLLTRRGHDVFTAEDGVSGLHCIRKEHPEVGIIDIAMPGMDGYELAATVKAHRVPVFLVALTGYGHSDDVQRAKGAGFDAHLTKPADLDTLEQLIATAAHA